MSKRIEILAPAGSYESFMAAIAAGADAVYIGGTRFGARAYADNLNEEALLKVIDYAHLHGRKVYLTVNTLLKEEELKKELYTYLLPYYMHGIDAVIVQDIGVLKYIREQFPLLPIHASTQMTITNVLGAKLLEELGVERVVTSRELQLNEIKEISEQTILEIESFVHGALCYCYSGQCLYSSMLGGRSGNRGQCAQPCRLPYSVGESRKNQYVLSLKDMCTLEIIPELIEAGIHSFKIEGRMKKPEYVALVTAMYRKYVDLYFRVGKKGYFVKAKDREMLMDLYNRGGSHDGYYHTKNGAEMVSLARPNHAGVPVLEVISQKGKQIKGKTLVEIHKGDVIELSDENFTFGNDVRKGQIVDLYLHKPEKIQKGTILNRTRNTSLINEIQNTIIKTTPKEQIEGKLTVSEQQPMKLELRFRELSVSVEGDVAQKAVTHPTTKERIESQLRKTGNTEFEFETLEVEMEGECFIPLQSLNDMRRRGIECLENKILSGSRRERVAHQYQGEVDAVKEVVEIPIHVCVEEKEQWEEVLSSNVVKRIYLDCNLVERIWENSQLQEFIKSAKKREKAIYLAMPHIFRKETIRKYSDAYQHIFACEWDGVLVRNYESIQFLQEHNYDKNIVTDFNLYQFNQYAKRFWKELNMESTTAPLELNLKELRDVGIRDSELVIYGYAPMMVSAQCVQKTTGGCSKSPTRLKLRDRYHKDFIVKNLCDYCYNIIYNSSPTMLFDQKDEVITLQPKALRINFTVEKNDTVKEVLNLYEDIFCKGVQVDEIDMEFTRGHFKRGIK